MTRMFFKCPYLQKTGARQTREGVGRAWYGKWEVLTALPTPRIYSLPIAFILLINPRIGSVITLVSWLFYYCCWKTTVFSESVLHAQSL